mgnify:CR=1 FL=1
MLYLWENGLESSVIETVGDYVLIIYVCLTLSFRNFIFLSFIYYFCMIYVPILFLKLPNR